MRMTTSIGLALILGAALAPVGLCAENESPKKSVGSIAAVEEPSEPEEINFNANLWIVLRILRDGKETRIALLTKSGTQANTKVAAEEGPFQVVVNVLPAIDPNHPDRVDFQYQIELEDLEGKRRGFSVQGEAVADDRKPKTVFESGGLKATVELAIERRVQ